MNKKIIYKETNKKINFLISDLPMLIHGRVRSGSSLFSISVAVQYFLRNNSILFFSAYPMATEEFLEQIKPSRKKRDVFCLNSSKDINKAKNYRAVIVKSGEIKLFLGILLAQKNIDKRIIFIKNVDSLLSKKLFDEIKKYKRVILSGDFTKIKYIDRAQFLNFQSRVLFSDLKINSNSPLLDKREAFMKGRINGIIKLADFNNSIRK